MRVRTFARALMAALIVISSWTPGARAAAARFGPAIDDTRAQLRRLEKLGFAGSVVIAVDGEPLLAEGYGLANRQRNIPWTTATVASTGSLTKQFTAAAILRLQEDHRLAVDDTIDRYFANVPADKRAITLHQLLTHTSGIDDLAGKADYDPVGREEFVRLALAQPLGFAPGTDYSYSNAGYSLLGAIIEQVSGVSYEEYLRRTFLIPLGLYETGYVLPRWDATRVAHGYRGAEDWGTVLGHPIAPDGPWWVLRANGGIESTAFDMLRWSRALLEGRALKPESIDRLWTPHADEGGGSSYGYGWSIRKLDDGTKVVTHNGSNGIFYAELALVPRAGLVASMETNVFADQRGAEKLVTQVLQRLLAGTPYPRVPDVATMSAADRRALAGTYALEGGGLLRVTAEGDALLLEAGDPVTFSLLHSVEAIDAGRAARLDRILDAAIRAARQGDFAPLTAAYGGTVPVERLRSSWSERMKGASAELGSLRAHQVLGTARTAEGLETVVRLLFEKGARLSTYVWSLEDAPQLRGRSDRGLEIRPRFLPVNGAAFSFESWDGGVSPSRPLRIGTANGRTTLTLGAPGPEVRATRR